MKLSTLKQIERAKWRLMRTLVAARKASPLDHEIRALHEAAAKDWLGWLKRHDAAAALAAEKKDKGEVLFTIFYPDGGNVRSITRTPNRIIQHWESRPWYASKPFEDTVQVRKPADWKWDFEYHNRTLRERLEKAKAA